MFSYIPNIATIKVMRLGGYQILIPLTRSFIEIHHMQKFLFRFVFATLELLVSLQTSLLTLRLNELLK